MAAGFDYGYGEVAGGEVKRNALRAYLPQAGEGEGRAAVNEGVCHIDGVRQGQQLDTHSREIAKSIPPVFILALT